MKKRLLKFIAIACSLTFVASAGVGVASWLGSEINRAKAYEITLESENELQSEYAYGMPFSIPTGTIEGQKTTKSVIISPSGKIYEASALTLDETGEYTVVWYAKVGGKEVSAKKKFLVTESIFSINGSADCKYVESLEKVKKSKTDGIKLSLQPESSFRYNKAIDLSDSSVPFAHVFPYHGITNTKEALDEEAELDKPLNKYNSDVKAEKKINPNITDEEIKIKFGEAPKDYSPEYRYNEEARNYLFTLTDCYDPTNYVTIDLEWQEGRTYWNFRAGAVGQTAHGLRTKEAEGVEQVLINGALYTPYFAPGQGSTSCNVMDDYGLQLYYDTTDNCVYITYCRYTASAGYVVNEKWLVADLDNEAIYPQNPFKGFTTGEVYLTISAKNYVGNVANVDIASLGGAYGEDMLIADMHDTKAPVIEVNEALRQGKTFVALNEEVQIPTAFALDLSLPYGTKATTAVYYNYNPNSDKNVLMGISNGKFTPTKKGIYTIVYSATDRSGNVATETVELQCMSMSGLNNKAVVLTVDGKIEAMAGDYVNIPECVIDGLYVDKSALKTYVQFEDGEKALIENDKLFLRGVGNYTLTYVYETPFKTYTATSVIKASASNNISFEAPSLPEYFIKGTTYTLDGAYAEEYTAKEPISVLAKTYMSADNGEYVEVNNKAVVIDAENSVRFKYEYNGKETYSEEIKVVDVGFGTEDFAMEKYFHSEEDVFTSSAYDQGVKYITNGTVKDAMLKYVNVLSLSSFSIDFDFEAGAKNEYVAPGAITFTLVDYYDRDNKVTLRFTGGGTSLNFSVNGEGKNIDVASFFSKKFSVGYDDDENGFVLEGKTYPWDSAFASDKILLWVSLEGMEDATCLNISRVNGERLTNKTADNADPVLYTEKNNDGYQPYNTVITITQAIACDIMMPYVEDGLTLTVYKPNGDYATSVDGVLLDGTCPVDRAYELKLNEFGVYTVLYEYYDQNGDDCSLSYYPTVKDEIPPVLKVNGVSENQVVEASWGETVTVASFTASDDVSTGEDFDAWVSVIYPSGILRVVENGGTFYAEEKGDYTVLYCAYDVVGNHTTFAYVVRVS